MNTKSIQPMYGDKIKFSYYDEGCFLFLKTNLHNAYTEIFETHLKFYSNYYYIINQNIIQILFKIALYKEKELEKYETAICIAGVLNDKNNEAFSIQEKIEIMVENYVYLLNYLKRKGKYRKFLRQYDLNTLKERVMNERRTTSLVSIVWLLQNPKLYLRFFSVDCFES